eukprot:TRINITY_DN10657_c0_g1_i1.p1 TRINITY_DN10657_c0_g1~~TRINITY_DN10657_c0_g1_i1.p1  ORF type:complete len:478 (+),score=141.78 TRINITY_DN10657_c0_g1_i1:274-1707(+)
MMHTRMVAWKEQTESNQRKYLKEIEELRDKLATRSTSPTEDRESAEGEEPTEQGLSSKRVAELEAELQKANTALEEAHWASLNTETKLNETRQQVEEKTVRIRQLEEEVESETSKHQHETQEHREAVSMLENKISLLEEKFTAATEEVERAKAQQHVRAEEVGQEQQNRQREMFELQSKIPELQQQNNNLSRQLDDEKQTVQQLLQHIEEQRGDVRRKDDTISDLYQEADDIRARLQGLESQSATYIESLESREEIIDKKEREIESLKTEVSSLTTQLSDQQNSFQEQASELLQARREIEIQESRLSNVEFEFERTKSDLLHREGGERDTKQQVELRDQEIQQLRLRLLESDRKIGDFIKVKDEQSAKLRAAENRTPSRRSVSIARPGSPSVIDIVKSAASESNPAALKKAIPRPVSFNPTTKQIVITLAIFLVAVWIWFSSGVAKSTEQTDLQDTIKQLRSIIAVKDRALTSCKCT